MSTVGVHRSLSAVVVASVLASAPVACKVGSHTETYSFEPKCGRDAESCVDNDTARLCDGDELATFECRGPDGCRVYGGAPKHVSCDRSKAREGDRCVNPSPRSALHTCSEDARARLACEGGAWVKQRACVRCFNKTADGVLPHVPTHTVECE